MFGSDTPFGVAARQVASRYPNFKTARKADDPSFIDSHPSGALATGHAELKGYGVTMIQGKRSGVVENASGDLADPSLLFFQKTGKDEDDWGIIGMGYSYQHDRDNESGPTEIAGVDSGIWWLHEAGYHRSPGDGGFTCATNDDLQKSVFDAGKRIDAEGCMGIDREDLKTREFHADRKHGRYWALHVWFEPSTRTPDARVERSLVPTKRQCTDGPLLRLPQAGILLGAASLNCSGRFAGTAKIKTAKTRRRRSSNDAASAL